MGFGHRVYKNFDPRATIIREMCHKVLGDLGVNDPMLDVAMELEEVALKDPYFVERKLYPNVDFYSGIIYKALKIPTEMFTVMFAIARTAGWVAHWLEQHKDQETKIGRPRQIYTGAANRNYAILRSADMRTSAERSLSRGDFAARASLLEPPPESRGASADRRCGRAAPGAGDRAATR